VIQGRLVTAEPGPLFRERETYLIYLNEHVPAPWNIVGPSYRIRADRTLATLTDEERNEADMQGVTVDQVAEDIRTAGEPGGR
jgi:hypothetical protein